MTVWFVIAVPVVVMLFALGMEKVEHRLRHVSVRGEDVEEFLEQARPDEVKALYGHGIGRALELFRLRRLAEGQPRASNATSGVRLFGRTRCSTGPSTGVFGRSRQFASFILAGSRLALMARAGSSRVHALHCM